MKEGTGFDGSEKFMLRIQAEMKTLRFLNRTL
jgi:hypothetical protein